MPPDFGAPVAQNVNVDPNKGLTTLSNLMGLKQQQQQLQIGTSQVQQTTQQMRERQIQQTMMQSGTDPDGNSIKGSDGEMDPVAFSAAANKYMPLTGQAVTQSILTTLHNRVQLNDAVRGLNQNYRNDISGIVRSGVGSQDNIGPKLDAYTAQNPQAGPAVLRAKALLQNLNPNVPQENRDKLLLHLSQEFQPSATTESEQTPNVQSYVTSSSELGTRQVNPLSPVPMGKIGPTVQAGLAPSERTSVSINPLTGQPYTVVRSPSGVGATAGGMGGAPSPSGGAATSWPKLGMFPTPQQTQSAMAAAQESDIVRAADTNPVSGYAPTKQVYSNLLDLIQKNPRIGPNSQIWNRFIGSIGTGAGLSANSSMQEVDSYLDRLALQNAGAAGLSTDAARHMSAVAAGTTEMNPEALKEKLRFGAATLEASHAYRAGLDNVIGTANQNPIAKRAFDASWAKNADIMAFRLLAAKNNGDKEGYNHTLNQIQSLPDAQKATVQQHMKNLNLLGNGQMPP